MANIIYSLIASWEEKGRFCVCSQHINTFIYMVHNCLQFRFEYIGGDMPISSQPGGLSESKPWQLEVIDSIASFTS